MTPAEIKKLKVPELKEQLKERGLDTTGKKDALVARLEAALADEPAASTEPAAAPVSEQLPKTAVEALRATDFVLASAEHAKNCQSVCKLLFDLGAQHCLAPRAARVLSSTVRSPPPCAGKQQELQPLGPLPTLMLDGFDMDGVWGQLELRNEPLLAYARSQARREQKSEQGMRKEERMAEAAARPQPQLDEADESGEEDGEGGEEGEEGEESEAGD